MQHQWLEASIAQASKGVDTLTLKLVLLDDC